MSELAGRQEVRVLLSAIDRAKGAPLACAA
jgi:hypothetical protein